MLVFLTFSQGECCLEQIISLLCHQQMMTPVSTQPSPVLPLHQYCNLLKALLFCVVVPRWFLILTLEKLFFFRCFLFICMSKMLAKKNENKWPEVQFMWTISNFYLTCLKMWEMMEVFSWSHFLLFPASTLLAALCWLVVACRKWFLLLDSHFPWILLPWTEFFMLLWSPNCNIAHAICGLLMSQILMAYI